MFGWLIFKNNNNLRTLENTTEYVCNNEVLEFDSWCIQYTKYPYFDKEQLCILDDQAFLATEGVLLNSHEIVKDKLNTDLANELRKAFSDNAIQTIENLNGPYCGVYHDRVQNKTIIFTNRIGDRPVYYYDSKDYYIASSNINLLISFCNRNNLKLTFDYDAGNMMLELGFLADTCTMVKEIKRLFPGECMIWEHGNKKLLQYYLYDNICDDSISLNDAIEQVDMLFRQAVKRCFDKNDEFGYKQIADLSGGLDSRMTTWIAREMGYKPFVNLNWGMSGCEDFTISAKIAAYLGNDLYFESLDSMNCFYDIDESVMRNYGAALYIGPTGALRFAKNMNSKNFGLKHSGQLGDVVIGSFVHDQQHAKPNEKSVIGYSEVKNCRIPYERFLNVEQARYYIRGFLGVTNTSQLQNEYFVIVSPFLDNDLMQYCMKIPLKYRNQHYLYIKWIEKKHPDALKFRRNDSLLSVKSTYLYPRFASIVNRAFHKIRRDSQSIMYKLKLSKYCFRLDGMTPLDAVFERDVRLGKFMQEYFDKSVVLFSNNIDFQQYLTKKYQYGKVVEKAMVLTVLSFVKQHEIEV